MALLTEQREPEMARFIDTYKFEQDKATRRDRFGGGTSLPLDSDGYEDKQRVLREERHKDWLQQQDKPRDPVYYRVGTPEEGFLGLGEYEKRRHEMNVIRQKEYNDLLRKQREMEHQKLEARRHQSPPRPAQPPGAQLDYHIQSEKARAEEKRAYQDYMGKYQYPSNVQQKPAIDYEENKRLLNEERKREYNQLMEKKAKEERYWAMRGRPVTPPGGLNIGNYDRQVKETAAQKKKEYKEMLDQQQREHMYLRARQEPEVPVLDRNAQPSNYLANKPPPGPGYTRARDEAFKTSHPSQPAPLSDQPYNRPLYAQEGHKYDDGPEGLFEHTNQSQDRPRSRRSLDVEQNYSNKPEKQTMSGNQISPRRTKNPLYKDSEEVNTKRREASKERQKEYNDYLKQKAEDRRRQDDMKHQQQQSSKPAEVVKNPFYSSDDYEKFQREIQRKQAEDYKDFLAKDEEQRRETRQNYNQEPPRTTYGTFFKHPPPSPKRIYHQTPPSPLPRRMEEETQQNPPMQNGYSGQNYNGPAQQEYMPEVQKRQDNQQNSQYPFPSNASDHGDYRARPQDNQEELLTGSFQHQMTAPYPKATSGHPEHSSLPATPSKLSLPLGQYDDMRPFIVKQRNKEYNHVKDKLGRAQVKRPKTPETTAVSLPVGKYDELRPALEKQRNAEYRQYLQRLPPLKKTGITPQATSLSLPVGQYDKARPMFETQRNQEYNELVNTGRIGKRTIRQKAPTPPDQQGLPIGQQHYEPMHKAMEQQRNKEYNEFLQKKYGNKNLRTTRSEPDRPNANEDKASFYYGSDKAQDEKRKMLEEERKNEYNQFIKELDPPPSKSMEIPTDVESGLPIGQQHHEAWRKFLRAQRNKEYNQFVDAKNAEVKHRDWNYEQNGILELRGDDAVQSKQRELRAERQRDYNNYMSQQRVSNPSRRHEFVDTASGPYGGLFHGLGEHGNRSDVLNKERQQEYNDLLTQQYGKDRPSGRPNWVKESIPNDKDRGRSPMRNPPPTDHYQQMLDEKRREEANRRRYDDPEYQGRLGQGRDRGEAGQRLGY